jgi:hypothetical protein
MPTFHFNLSGRTPVEDVEGQNLPSLIEAMQEAVGMAGDLARNKRASGRHVLLVRILATFPRLNSRKKRDVILVLAKRQPRLLRFRESARKVFDLKSQNGSRAMPSQDETVFDPWVALCLLFCAVAMLIWVTIE